MMWRYAGVLTPLSVYGQRTGLMHVRLAIVLSLGTAPLLLWWIDRIGATSTSPTGPVTNFAIMSYDWTVHDTRQLSVYLVAVLVAAPLFGLLLVLGEKVEHSPVLLRLLLSISVVGIVAWTLRGGLIAAFAGPLVAAVILRLLRMPWANRILIGSAIGLLSGWGALHLLLPLFRGTVSASSTRHFIYQQEHWAMSVLPALDVVDGSYADVGYGHMPGLLGLGRAAVAAASGQELSIVRTVLLAHVLAVLIIGAFIWTQRSRAALVLAAVGLLAIPDQSLSALSNLSVATTTGQRYVPALTVIAALGWHARLRSQAWFRLGLIVGSAAAISAEVGAVSAVAAGSYAILREAGHPGGRLRVASRLVAGSIVSLLGLSGILGLLGGAGGGNLAAVRSFLGGFGGVTRPLDPVAAIVALTAVLLLTAILIDRRPIGPSTALAGGLMAAAVVQWAVYANRTVSGNSWFATLLLVLAVVALGRGLTDPDVDHAPAPTGVLTVGVLAICSMAALNGPPGLPQMQKLTCSHEPYFGFCIEGEESLEIRAALDELGRYEPDRTVVLASASSIVRSLGFNADLPNNRGVFYTDLRTSTRTAIEELQASDAVLVVVQTPTSALGRYDPALTDLLLTIAAASGVPDPSLTSSHWLAFRRFASAGDEASPERPSDRSRSHHPEPLPAVTVTDRLRGP